MVHIHWRAQSVRLMGKGYGKATARVMCGLTITRNMACHDVSYDTTKATCHECRKVHRGIKQLASSVSLTYMRGVTER